MDATSATARILHDEHMAARTLLGRAEKLLLSHAADAPPALNDVEIRALLGEMISVLGGEIPRHFRFEEAELFPLLEQNGQGDMLAMLQDEHDVILPLARDMVALAKKHRSDGFDAAAWARFRRTGLDLAAQLTDHIEKEEMGLVPLIDELLDEDIDRALAVDYAQA